MLDNLTDAQIDEAAWWMAMRTVREQLATDEPCPECDGTGRCPECSGEPDLEDEACPDCRWTGECPGCDGSGRCA